MKPCKICGDVSVWVRGAKTYCAKHTPKGARLVCKADGCILTGKNHTDDGNFCHHHAKNKTQSSRKCSVETCTASARYINSQRTYCTKHRPDGSTHLYRRCCVCGGSPSFVEQGKKYCKIHAPAGASPVNKCCVEICKKWQTYRAGSSKYCKAHAPIDAVPMNGNRFKTEIMLGNQCGKFVKIGNGCFVFTEDTHDVIVEKTADYTPLPWNRPTTVILYQKIDFNSLCAAINRERQNFSGEIIRLP
jgi:hypothetical protein